MGLTLHDDALVGAFLAEFSLLNSAGTYKSVLMGVPLPISDPRGMAIAGVLLLMTQAGLSSWQVAAVQRYLVERQPEQLLTDVVCIRDGSVIDIPNDDQMTTLNLASLEVVEPPRESLTLTVWYSGPFMRVAQALYEEE